VALITWNGKVARGQVKSPFNHKRQNFLKKAELMDTVEDVATLSEMHSVYLVWHFNGSSFGILSGVLSDFLSLTLKLSFYMAFNLTSFMACFWLLMWHSVWNVIVSDILSGILSRKLFGSGEPQRAGELAIKGLSRKRQAMPYWLGRKAEGKAGRRDVLLKSRGPHLAGRWGIYCFLWNFH